MGRGTVWLHWVLGPKGALRLGARRGPGSVRLRLHPQVGRRKPKRAGALKADNDQLHQEVALLRAEIRIKYARMACVYYTTSAWPIVRWNCFPFCSESLPWRSAAPSGLANY